MKHCVSAYTVCIRHIPKGRLDFALNFFDENVQFISYAPIGVFPCLGQLRGKVGSPRLGRPFFASLSS